MKNNLSISPNETHWLISAGLLNYQGNEIVPEEFVAVTRANDRRTPKEIRRDKEKLMELISAGHKMSRSMYERLKEEGFLTCGFKHMTYYRFAVLCTHVRKKHLGMDVRPTTNKVLDFLKEGKSRKEIAVILKLTRVQVESAIGSLRIRGVL